MKNVTKTLIAAVLGITALSKPADAYTYSFINTLDKPVRIDFCGIAMIGCTMFAGDTLQGEKEHVKIDNFGNFTRYREAQWLYGPQTVPPGKMVAYDFRGWSIGICINIDSMKISVDGGAFMPLTAYHVESSYASSVIERLGKLGDSVKKLGDAGADSDKTSVKVAGKVVSALGGFLKPVADLYAVSACKDGTFIIGIDEKGKLVMQTSDF